VHRMAPVAKTQDDVRIEEDSHSPRPA
jgi:hypothetical protein